MTNQPAISYRKSFEDKNSIGAKNSPASVSSPVFVIDSYDGDSTNQTRKVSHRRRALQDFYNLNKSEQASSDEVSSYEESNKSNIEEDSTVDIEKYEDENYLTEYLKKSSIKDILKLRNSIVGKFASQSQEKKSIIYNNYQELIKLNEVLLNLSVSKPTKHANVLDNFGTKSSGNKSEKDDYIDRTLSNLTNFFSDEVSNFKGNFESVIKNFSTKENTDTDSDNKLTKSQAHNIDSETLVKEIDTLLSVSLPNLDDISNVNIRMNIENILSKLNPHHDDLLIYELNEIKRRLY